MRARVRMLASAMLSTMTATAAIAQATPVTPASRPPAIAPSPVTEAYFGTKVTDRFRGLEALDATTLTWMRAQSAYTRGVLDTIAPRAAFLARLHQFAGGFGAVNSPVRAGDRLFYEERAPGRDQFDLMVRDADGTKRRLIDVTALIAANKGVPHAIDYFTPSNDGRRVAVGISSRGSENSELSIVDASTGATLGGPIERAQFGATAWMPDGSGLFFNRLQALGPNDPPLNKYLNSTVEYWTGKGAPVVVVGAGAHLGPNADPVRFPYIATTTGSDQALLIVSNGVANEKEGWVAPLADARAGRAAWRKVFGTEDAVTSASADAAHVFLLTHKQAPTFKVTMMPWTGTAATATVVIPARPGRINELIAVGADALYVEGREGLYAQPLRVSADGAVTPIALPFKGAIAQLSADPAYPGAIFVLDTYDHPPTSYEYRTGKLTDLGLETRPAINYARFQTAALSATAHDGTKVPLTVLTVAGPRHPRPLLLDAYGAYGISALPYFSPTDLAFVEAGGTLAECNVRGGGELGEAWRLGGKDANKPNTWRDAIACGEALIAAGFTTRTQLAITGTSAGGIMVGRAATERPDLFAAAISRVGDSDALRSETMVSGPANVPEFGTVKDRQGFTNLFEMDAYQHVADGKHYPAWMLTTGLNDPRVAPWEAGKMAARLQEVGDAPVLLRVEEQAGHGMGSTRSEREAEWADIYAFVFWRAGVPAWQPSAR